MFNETQIERILTMYDNNESTYVIAQEFNTYPNKIRRVLLKNGRTLRSKKEAQKLALATGRSEHPTEGKERSEEVKTQISESTHKYWKKMSPKEHQKRVDRAREQWYNMSEAERDAMNQAASRAIREASRNGSKLEQFLRDKIEEHYSVIFHKTGLVANTDLEVDLFIPSIKTAIEVDGPSHFFPIWGEEKLKKHIKADADKTGLLLNGGFCIVRVKHTAKNVSEKYKRDLLKLLLETLKKIDKKFPPKGKRFIELEVK